MAFHCRPIFAFLFLALVVASQAALSPEDYWKSVLPNAPIPKAIKDTLPPAEWMKVKSMSIDLGKLAANMAELRSLDNKNYNMAANMAELRSLDNKNYDMAANMAELRPLDDKNFGKAAIINEKDSSESRFHFHPKETMFFLVEDMNIYRKMNLRIINREATFLPRQIAQSMPFSSKNLPQILSSVQIQPNSAKAEIIKETIKTCERPGVKGEQKYCVTSLESMINFCTSKFGRNVQAISADTEKEAQGLQEYSITSIEKLGAKDQAIACHKLNYAYAVFYCHLMPSTKAYMVSLDGANGRKAEALAVCHEDTSSWNPNHLSFQILKVKPGTVPICHFLDQDAVVWLPK